MLGIMTARLCRVRLGVSSMKAALLFGFLAIAMPAEASAQMFRKSPSPVGEKYKESDFEGGDYSREVMDRFGKCIAKKDKEYARKFVLGEVPENEVNPDNKFVSPYCLSGNDARVLRFYSAGLLGPVAEFLIEKDLGGPIALDVANVEEAAEEGEANAGDGPRMRMTSMGDFLADIGTCIVTKHQPEALGMLNSKIGKANEDEAVRAILPFLEECTQSAAEMPLDRTALRTAIAVGYYRLAAARADQ